MSDYLPGGKNYLDPANFDIQNDTMTSIDPIRVKPDTTYVIHIPPRSMLGYASVTITNGTTVLLDGMARDLAACDENSDRTECVFTTTSYHYLDIVIEAQGLSQYIAYYGFEGIQMEEGTTATTYEPYIAPYIDVNSPEFEGSATFVKAYYETISIQDIIDAHILVLDDIDGDITHTVVISDDGYTSNMHTTGHYTATLTATDSSGNTASMELNVLVKDEVAPEIQGPDRVMIDVDQPLALADVIANEYVVVDGHDGVLTPTITTDQYTPNMTMIGSYDVILDVVDAAGNQMTRTIALDVVDLVSPVLVTNPNLSVYLSDPKSIDAILDELIVSDNYDSATSLSFAILSDTYTNNALTPGTYDVQVVLSDLSGNGTHETLLISVIDDVAPIISGPTLIQTSYQGAPSLQDLIDQLTVTDNVDPMTNEDLVVTLDTYSGRVVETGSFEVTVEATDSSGNTSSHTIQLTIVDDKAPVIYIDNYLVTVTTQATFAPADAVRVMINNGAIPEDEYAIETLHDEYTGNETVPGTYLYRLKLIASDGTTIQREFVIRVAGDESIETSPWPMVRNAGVYALAIAFSIYVVKRRKR
jgi:hypothetical protein